MAINRRHADGSTGRRLTPAELANVAAAMGLPVSPTRYQPETAEHRNRRAVAYQDAMATAAKLRSPGVPRHLRDKRLPKKRRPKS